VGCCEHRNQSSGSIKTGNFLLTEGLSASKNVAGIRSHQLTSILNMNVNSGLSKALAAQKEKYEVGRFKMYNL
jgi:hypothetical protein